MVSGYLFHIGLDIFLSFGYTSCSTTQGVFMILVIIAALLFLFVGNTGKVVRLGLTALICNIIVYFGIPLFAAVLFYMKVSA